MFISQSLSTDNIVQVSPHQMSHLGIIKIKWVIISRVTALKLLPDKFVETFPNFHNEANRRRVNQLYSHGACASASEVRDKFSWHGWPFERVCSTSWLPPWCYFRYQVPSWIRERMHKLEHFCLFCLIERRLFNWKSIN